LNSGARRVEEEEEESVEEEDEEEEEEEGEEEEGAVSRLLLELETVNKVAVDEEEDRGC
jgi:hypothetical protein